MNTSKHQYSVRCFLAFREISINNLRVTPATAEFVAPIEVQNTQYDKMPIQLWYSRNGESESLLFDGVVTQVAPVKEKNKTLYSQVRCEAGVYNALKNTYLHTFTPEKVDFVKEKLNYNLQTNIATPAGNFNDTSLKSWLLTGEALKSPADILTKFVDLIAHKDAEGIANTTVESKRDFRNEVVIRLAFAREDIPPSAEPYKNTEFVYYDSQTTDKIKADIYVSFPDLFKQYGVPVESTAEATVKNMYNNLITYETVSESTTPEANFTAGSTESSAEALILKQYEKEIAAAIAAGGSFQVALITELEKRYTSTDPEQQIKDLAEIGNTAGLIIAARKPTVSDKKTAVPLSGDAAVSVVNALNRGGAEFKSIEEYEKGQEALSIALDKMAKDINSGALPIEVCCLLYYLASYNVFRNPGYAALPANSDIVILSRAMVTGDYYRSMQKDVVKSFLAQYFAMYFAHYIGEKAGDSLYGFDYTDLLYLGLVEFANFSFQASGFLSTKASIENMFSSADLVPSSMSGGPEQYRDKLRKVDIDPYFTKESSLTCGEVTNIIANNYESAIDLNWYFSCGFLLYYFIADNLLKSLTTNSGSIVSASSFSKVNTSVAGLDCWRHKVFDKIQDGYKIRGVQKESVFSYFCNLKKIVGQDVVLNHVAKLLVSTDVSLLALINSFLTSYQHKIVLTFPKKTSQGYCELFIDRDFMLNAYPDKRYSKYIPAAFTQDFGKKVFVSSFNYIFRVNDENLYRLSKSQTPLVYDIQNNKLVGISEIDSMFDEIDRFYTSPQVVDIVVDPTLRDVVASVQTNREQSSAAKSVPDSPKQDYTNLVRAKATKKLLDLYNQILFKTSTQAPDIAAPTSSWLLVFESFMPGVDTKALADMIVLSIWELGGENIDGFKKLYSSKCTEEFLKSKVSNYNLFPVTLSTSFPDFGSCCAAMLELAQSKEAGVNYSLVQKKISKLDKKVHFYDLLAAPLYSALLKKLGGVKDDFFLFMYRVMLGQLAGESGWGVESSFARDGHNYGGIAQGLVKFKSDEEFCKAYVDYYSGIKSVSLEDNRKFTSGLKINLIDAIRADYKKNGDGCVVNIVNIYLDSGYIVPADTKNKMYTDYASVVNSVDLAVACAKFDQAVPASKVIVPTMFPGKLNNKLATIKNMVPVEYWDLLSSVPGDLNIDASIAVADVPSEETLPFGDTVATMLYTPAIYKLAVSGNIPDFVKPFSITASNVQRSALSSGDSAFRNDAQTVKDKSTLYFLEIVDNKLLLKTPKAPTENVIYYNKEQEDKIKIFFAQLLPASFIWYCMLNYMYPSAGGIAPSISWFEQMLNKSASKQASGTQQDVVTEDSDFDTAALLESVPSVEDVKAAVSDFPNKMASLVDRLDRALETTEQVSRSFVLDMKSYIDVVQTSIKAVNYGTISDISKDALSTVSGSIKEGIRSMETIKDNKFGYTIEISKNESCYSPSCPSIDGKEFNVKDALKALLKWYPQKKADAPAKTSTVEQQMQAMNAAKAEVAKSLKIDNYDTVSEQLYSRGVLPLMNCLSMIMYVGGYYYNKNKSEDFSDLETVISELESCGQPKRVASNIATLEKVHWDSKNIRPMEDVARLAKKKKTAAGYPKAYSIHPYGVAIDVDYQTCIDNKLFGSKLVKSSGNNPIGPVGSKGQVGWMFLKTYAQRLEFEKYMNKNAPAFVSQISDRIQCPLCKDLFDSGYVLIQIYDRHFHYDIARNSHAKPTTPGSMFMASELNSSVEKV